MAGRVLFEDLIRDNLDLGRPDQVALIFDRRVRLRGKHPTPSRFRTRVITHGVIPSLHVDYKHSRIKQYHKLGRALRTETTINDTRDFGIGKRLHNLDALRQVGFNANRRLLDVQQTSCDTATAAAAYTAVTAPAILEGQRAAALRFDDPRVQALLSALVVFRLLPQGFANRDLRPMLAQLLGLDPAVMTQGRMTYDLRRLRLHGLIARIPGSHRYHVTEHGMCVALLFTRIHNRVLRPGLAQLGDPYAVASLPLRRALDRLNAAIDTLAVDAKLH